MKALSSKIVAAMEQATSEGQWKRLAGSVLVLIVWVK